MLHRPGQYELRRLDPESLEFQALVEESRVQGYWMLVRLADGWRGGGNRFRRRGEMLVGAWQDAVLAGVAGLNIDPYVEGRREGRVRHLYVGSAHRRQGVGRLLVGAIIDKARLYFPMLNARAPEAAFPFYEALGFKRVTGEEFHTHRMKFRRPRIRAEADRT
jgi:GNAT superfamily N-acetyltransferase